MPVGLLTLELHIPDAQSLKDKRQVLRSLKDRLRRDFNVAVAELEHHDTWQRSVVGVVSAPALGERYDAALRMGARMNGAPIRVSSLATIEEARVCFASWGGWVDAGLDRQWASILTRCRRSRGFGDFWGHVLVARGAAEAMAEPELQPWDVAALTVIVAEAGGRLTDFGGRPFRERGSCLTTNGRLHDEILQELSGA